MMADVFCGDVDAMFDSVHPPNIVLVNNTQSAESSPGQGADLPVCSPLSTAPNSPFRGVSYEEDEDEEDDEEDDDEEEEDIEKISPEEIQKLLDTPVSGARQLHAHEVPFDEGNNSNNNARKNLGVHHQTNQDSKIDPLLGNPRLYKATTTTATTKPTTYAVVSPTTTSSSSRHVVVVDRLDDIDTYEDRERSQNHRDTEDEKKVEDSGGTPPRQHQPSSSRPRPMGDNHLAVPFGLQSTFEDDNMPHDERHTGVGKYTSPQPLPWKNDFVDRIRNNLGQGQDVKAPASPMIKALQTAEREVQEMERRVQLMLEQRLQTSQRSQRQRNLQDAKEPEGDFSDGLGGAGHDEMREETLIEVEGEPPSLSPRSDRRDVNYSLESGVSSYYYDGSAMNSSSSRSEFNMTRDSTTSTSLPSSAQKSRPKDNSDYYLASPTFDAFGFGDHRQTKTTSNNDSSFARAFSQVTDDITSFVLGHASPNKKTNHKAPSNQQFPPISPSHDSDCTPQVGNLSPRPYGRSHSSTVRDDTDVDVDILFSRPTASAKLARARSLVSERQSKSPTSAPYHQNRQDDPKQRARQVMNRREREQNQQQQSLNRPATITKRSLTSSSQLDDAKSTEAPPAGPKGSYPWVVEPEAVNIPVPPSLHRLAAMVEASLGGPPTTSADHAQEVARELAKASYKKDGGEWPRSVSQLVAGYEAAITDTLRQLSVEEITGLAATAGQAKESLERNVGRKTMKSPGLSLSKSNFEPESSLPADLQQSFDEPPAGKSTVKEVPASQANGNSKMNDRSYDDIVEAMTFGACLAMPQLDHRTSETSQSTGARNVTGLPHCDDYGYRDDDYDWEQHLEPHMDVAEHQDRAVFARQLSERLRNLTEEISTDKSSSFEEVESSDKPEHARDNQGNSFVSKESFVDMSPANRGNPAYGIIGKAIMNMEDHADGVGSGICTANMPCTGESPWSPCSDNDDSPYRLDPTAGSNPPSFSKTNTFEADGMANIKPTMVESIDNETGIAKGDVMLSLLCDNSFQAINERPDSWAWRVREAVWRGREMRRTVFGGAGLDRANEGGQPQRKASLPVDVDDVRVIGGIQNVSSIQEKALAHMSKDEFEEALELYEDIIFNYYSFFEQVLAKRDEFSSEDVTMELSNFKPYIGASLHNLGVIHLLKGDYEDAFSFFKRAVDNRRACLGEAHSDTVSSLVRLATCRFAMDNFADAHTNLELALALAGSKVRTTNDYCQLGEILNNLGCLSYMCGQPTKAMKLFREALDVQLAVLNSTLYGGSKFSAHSATLNISITRGNIGFLALVLKDVSSGIVALESALREQRLLLNGAHVTLVSTMDHLAVANLLEGRTQKAVKMLRRIYDMQKSAHGVNDPRTIQTRQKIMTIRGQQFGPGAKNAHSKSRAPPQGSIANHGGSNQTKQPLSSPELELPNKAQPQRERPQPVRQSSESSRCAIDPRGSGNSVSNGSSSGKVNSVFKAIRSLGRKKS